MYATMEVNIKKGKVLPLEPEKLPESGRALLVVLDQKAARNDWKRVRHSLGWLKTDVDPSDWQNKVREQWRDPI